MFIFIRIFFLLTSLSISSSFAAGFQLFEGNAINIGDFGAGGAANLTDASAAYFNPAALSNLQCHQIIIAGTGVLKTSRFRGNAEAGIIDHGTGSALYTRNYTESNAAVKSPGKTIIPAIFYGTPITENFALGVGLSVPFGLSTDWPNDSEVRYSATETEIKTVNFGPGFSYKINKYVVIGGGVDIQYISAKLNSAIVPRESLGVTSDSFSKNSAHGTSLGGNIGVLLKPISKLDLSLHYRSRINHHVSGTSRFTGGLAPNGDITSEVSTRVTLPDTISFNGAYALTRGVKLLTGIYYTTWSTLKNITMKNIASPRGSAEEKIPLNFRNTWRFVVGTQVAFNHKMLVRTGIGYDQSTTKTEDRSIRAPDNNRIAVAIGGKYKLNKMFEFDIGYTHIFVKKANINHTLETFTQRSSLVGTVHNHVDLISLQVTANIC